MNSEFLKLKKADFWKGLVVAILTAGVTAIWMDKGLDTGDILGSLFFRPQGCAKFNCLLKHLGYQAANLTKSVILEFENIKPLLQINADASYAGKLSKEDGEIDFSSA